MSNPYVLLGILALTLGLFIWGRWRYDVVAVFSLMLSVLIGVVPVREAFSGFSNAAVITVACVMVITQAIIQSGVVDKIIKRIMPATQNIVMHVLVLSSITAVLSAFMNNIGALALMMPVAIRSALENKRSPSLVLMPLAFASMLGGLTTVIGTPPNILISSFRQENIGQPFSMFDFTPVGLIVAVCGIIYIAFAGWRLIPKGRKSTGHDIDKFHIKDYITEVRVSESARVVGKTVRELENLVEGDFTIVGVIRDKRKHLVVPQSEVLRVDDVLIIEATHKDLQELLRKTKLELVGEEAISSEVLRSDDIRLTEAVVPPSSRLEGRTSKSMRLRNRYHINLIAISRQGRPFKKRLNEVKFKGGDVVLLQGDVETARETLVKLGFLPLLERGVQVVKHGAFWPVGIFAIAIFMVALGWMPVQIGFCLAVLLLVLLNITPVRRIYESIDWSIIILLGAIIPVGNAFQATGGTDLLANWFVQLAGSFAPAIILGLLLIVTMTLSDVMNNAATAVVMAPIGVGIANAMHASIDPFLMAVAIGASCSFLTPIGHQNNTLVMGPGGYKFFDYLRVGFPLELIILFVGLPMILYFWPL